MKLLIQERFFGDVHHVWCSEQHDSGRSDPYRATSLVPPSSNPKDIYRDLRDATDRRDHHNATIARVRTMYAALSQERVNAGIMTNDERDELVFILTEPRHIARVLEELNARLSGPALSPERVAATRGRLGERGHLRPSDYDIAFPAEFDIYEDLGIRRAHTEAAIRHPDRFVHLPTMAADDEGVSGISLFAKRVELDRDRTLLMLIVAQRKGAKLQIESPWRLPADLFGPPEEPLLELLSRFAYRYGLPFRLGDALPTQFAYHVTTPLGIWGERPERVFFVENPEQHAARAVSIMRRSPLGVLQVVLAYAIDLTKYRRALADAGLL